MRSQLHREKYNAILYVDVKQPTNFKNKCSDLAIFYFLCYMFEKFCPYGPHTLFRFKTQRIWKKILVRFFSAQVIKMVQKYLQK